MPLGPPTQASGPPPFHPGPSALPSLSLSPPGGSLLSARSPSSDRAPLSSPVFL